MGRKSSKDFETGMKLLIKIGLYFIFFIYLLGALFDVRGGYRSGDELGFVSGFTDRGVAEDWFDPRYWLWIKYISGLESIGLSVPLLNVILFFTLLFKISRSGMLNNSVILVIPLIPSIFYFTNSYLRDYVFFLSAMYFLLHPEIRFSSIQGKLKFSWCLLLIAMRPVYGAMLISALIISSEKYNRFFRKIILLILVAVFFVAPIAILTSENIFNTYKDFFVLGHVREKNQFTVYMVNEDEFTSLSAAIIFISSFFKFWFIPPEGIGGIYDRILYVESLIFLALFFYGFFRLGVRGYFQERRFRIAVIMLIFSVIAAAGITTEGDIIRFRIFFIIYIFYFATYLRFVHSSKNKPL